MEKIIKHIAGRSHSVDYKITRNEMRKPIIIGEQDGCYLSSEGKLYVKEVFDMLFNPPISKIKKMHTRENPDKTKSWMK